MARCGVSGLGADNAWGILWRDQQGKRRMGQLIAMFFTILVAELGDKTQIATVMFAAEKKGEAWAVFIACAGALVFGAAISVVVGVYGGRWLQNVPLKLIAGIGFIVIGLWSLFQYYQGD
jgi:putative Ca2+/H+ antiporter (TMEM165/GDT1 family)